MSRLSLIGLVLFPLVFLGCASSRSAPPPPPTLSSTEAPQVSPAHPYCMYVRKAGELRECYQFAFGRCTAFGSRCDTPGFLTSGAGSGQGAAGSAP